VNRKADFFYKTNRFESIRIANWNALVRDGCGPGSALVTRAGCTSSAPAATTRDGEIHFTASAATLSCQLHSATIYTYTLIDALGSDDVMTIAAITIVHSAAAAAAADTQCV